MKKSEKEELKQIIDGQIQSVKKEIKELIELTKPVSLDASIGRLQKTNTPKTEASGGEI